MFMQTRLHMSPKRKKAQRAGFFVEASPPIGITVKQSEARFTVILHQACFSEILLMQNDRHKVPAFIVA
jgi:hypothetical protein